MNATIKATVSSIKVFFAVSYKTTNVAIKIIVSIILTKSKYHIPIPNENNIITASIPLHIIIGIIPLPFEYQHINAKIGENKVRPYHIII